MQFIVPQFIDIEPKIIGQITPRQFLTIIITAVTIGVCYKLFDFALFILTAIITAAVGASLAFLKVNGRPIYYFLVNILQTFRRPKIRVWRKEFIRIVEKNFRDREKTARTIQKFVPRPPLSSTRLSQVALLVDTGGKYTEENDISEL